jgi:3D (Asp-Asp-Asp) domain-containing protein
MSKITYVLLILGLFVYIGGNVLDYHRYEQLREDFEDLKEEDLSLKKIILTKNRRIQDLNKKNKELERKIEDFDFQLKKFKRDPMSWISKNYKAYNLEITAYSPTLDQCDQDPFIAASNKPVEDFTIAVSRNLKKVGWDFGKFVYIPELNQFLKIHDVMHKRYEQRVDIFMWDRQEACNFGYKESKVYLIH